MLRVTDRRWKMIDAAMSSIKSAKTDAVNSSGTESLGASVKRTKSQEDFTPQNVENDTWSACTDDNKEHEQKEVKLIMVDGKQQWRKETLENIQN